MKIFVFILILINFTVTNNKKFTVKGQVLNKPQSLTILFKNYNSSQNIQTVLDTILLDKSHVFHMEYDFPPGIYQVDFGGIHKVNFAIEQGQEVNINLVLPDKENDDPKVRLSGSKDAQLVFNYDKKQKAAYKKWLYPVRRNIRLAKETGNIEKIAQLSEQEKKNLVAYKNELAEYAKTNFGNSIALFYAAIRLDPELHMEFLEQIAATFNQLRPDLKLTKEYNEKIKRIKRTAIGSQAPDIVFKKEGRQIKLSDYTGQYVLLDFWAAWCNPCRIENINYAKLYKKYKDKAFEIFAVSIDTNEKLWKSASHKDKISWTNLSDFKGWNTSSALTYDITAIPANFLIDPTGKIIAKNIRGKDIQKKLAMIFK